MTSARASQDHRAGGAAWARERQAEILSRRGEERLCLRAAFGVIRPLGPCADRVSWPSWIDAFSGR